MKITSATNSNSFLTKKLSLSNKDEHLIYLPEEETALKAGDSVRITGGPFAGVEGELLRIKGDRRVVVKLAGFFTVATAFIHPSLLEKIDR